jgi:hypothetical protein
VLFVAFGSEVAEFTITVLTANEYAVFAVVVTVMVALAPPASAVNVHVNTPADWLQLPPEPPETEEETYVTSAGIVSTTVNVLAAAVAVLLVTVIV